VMGRNPGVSVIPAAGDDWWLPHDGAFLLVVFWGAGALAKLAGAPLLSSEAATAGVVLGVAMIAGRRLGYVPTKLLAAVGGAALVSVLAFVALLIAFLLFGGLCCS